MPIAGHASSRPSMMRLPLTRTRGLGVFSVMGTRREPKPAAILLSVTRLLYHLGNIFQEHTPQDSPTSVQAHHIDSKRMRQLQEKRLAMGHKPDDHEETQQGYGGTQSPW